MVGVGFRGKRSVLIRVSVVSRHGKAGDVKFRDLAGLGGDFLDLLPYMNTQFLPLKMRCWD